MQHIKKNFAKDNCEYKQTVYRDHFKCFEIY